jgi:hypothetical protein
MFSVLFSAICAAIYRDLSLRQLQIGRILQKSGKLACMLINEHWSLTQAANNNVPVLCKEEFYLKEGPSTGKL